ncbi:unnamed protein product [Phytophthora fragariaefolia]|uniref:Unnamed protein product n=1 Tax=Phytophthora fragariaefolia TaxID=1490495 RepID=A0A9W6YPS4_9STRA|nr:unnamed protein product [Phytophthora fragariaefolia]
MRSAVARPMPTAVQFNKVGPGDLLNAKPIVDWFSKLVSWCLEIQRAGAVSGILTQNVDRLHTKSGSHSVVEMHGSLHEVECQGCGHVTSRQSYQKALQDLNPKVAQWSVEHPDKAAGDVASSDKVNPDGDVDISWNYDDFVYPACSKCGGIVKPRCVATFSSRWKWGKGGV